MRGGLVDGSDGVDYGAGSAVAAGLAGASAGASAGAATAADRS